MHQRFSLLTFLTLAAFLVSFAAKGKVHSSAADSLKHEIAEQRILMHKADSTENVPMAIAVRSYLATLVRPREAILLLKEAASLARSSDRLDDEIAMRTYLSRAYAAVNDHRKAYASSMEVVALNSRWASIQAERSGARTDSLLAEAKEAHMETIRTDMIRQLKVEEAAARQRKLTGRWMVIAMALLALAVLVVVALLFRGGQRSQRTRAELAGLRAEVAAMRSSTSNRVREVAPVIKVDPSHQAVPDQVETPVDETVRAMFALRAPERLATLRDARARSDAEKVVRVVHTLKPLLVAMESNLGSLCAAIIASNANVDPVRWNSDLDQLEAELERMLR